MSSTTLAGLATEVKGLREDLRAVNRKLDHLLELVVGHFENSSVSSFELVGQEAGGSPEHSATVPAPTSSSPAAAAGQSWAERERSVWRSAISSLALLQVGTGETAAGTS